MLVYKINNHINGQKLLHDIERLVNKSISPDKEYLLVVRVQEINYNDEPSVKIEHKPE